MSYQAKYRWSSARRVVRLVVLACLAILSGAVFTANANEPWRSVSYQTSQPVVVEAVDSGLLSGGSVQSLPVIDGREVACRAARSSPLGRALRSRARTIVKAYADKDECDQRAAASLASFLIHQACHQEDIAAANALRAYYARIGLQEQLRLSEQSVAGLASEQTKQQAALEAGLRTGVDYSSFERRSLEIQDQRLQLLSQDRQLRSLLAQLAQTDYDSESVRQEQLDVRATELDCEQLKAFALATRCDLRGWSNLAGQTTPASVPMLGPLLSTSVGGFGLPMPAVSGLRALLCRPDLSGLVKSLQHEIQGIVDGQRRAICLSVEEKCLKLQLAYGRIELARSTIESWEGRLAQLESLAQLGDPSAIERAAASLGLLQARFDEISRRLEARTAEVDLAEAMGGLSRRCCDGQAWLVTSYLAP